MHTVKLEFHDADTDNTDILARIEDIPVAS